MKTVKLGNREVPVIEMTEEECKFIEKCSVLDGIPPVAKGKDSMKSTERKKEALFKESDYQG